MAGTTQYFGVTYPTSTDYVKDGAVAIEAVADGFDAALAIPTYNTQTGTSYTFVLLDAAKVTTSNNASAATFTIPPQASVVWTTGATLTVANYGAGAVTIAGGAGVTVTNSTSTIGQYGSASIIRTASNAWTVIPFAGGAAPLSDSAISGTTGSPTTGTFTDTGVNYKFYKFTGSGSITLSKAGLVDVAILGGGGGSVTSTFSSHRSGGAGGGGLTTSTLYLQSGATTITVGAGGAIASIGVASKIGSILSMGGGEGGGRANPDSSANDYACGGGGGNNGGIAGTGIVGFNGANGPAGDNASGGGGGMGGNASTTTGGVGLANSLTGTAVTYGAGGAGQAGSGAGTAGAANTGNGASGSGGVNNGAAGGSGIVVIRVLA